MPRKNQQLRICGAPFFVNLYRLFARLPSSSSACHTKSTQEASTSYASRDMSSSDTNTIQYLKEEDLLDWENADREGVRVEPGYRYPIEYLVKRWEAGEKEPLEKVLRAFMKIKALDPNDRRSFTYIAGLHGKPFIQRPDVEKLRREDRYEYWGGYCPHGTVLFPVWHRAYLDYMEKAMQQFEPGVTLPYWDEISPESLKNGVPDIFTRDKVSIDGELVDNPLKSFTFPQKTLFDQLPEHSDDAAVKAKIEEVRRRFNAEDPYTTVRFPFFHEGVGKQEHQRAAAEANKRYAPGGEDATEALNKNVAGWLANPNEDDPESATVYYTAEKYRMSLDVPNYTLYSCTTAMAFHQETTGEPGFSLEGPHNDMHDACGFVSPPLVRPEQFAYGDIGTLETSSFDPLFWFHHCFVDRMFWYWQRMHDATDNLEVIEGYPGARSVDGFGGPTVGQQPTETLSMNTPLFPFVNCECDGYFIGLDMANIQNLGYMYKGSGYTTLKFVTKPARMRAGIKDDGSRGSIMVKQVDRTRFSGTFVVVAYLKVGDDRRAAGYDTVFNRLIPEDCPGCMHHKMRTFVFPLNRMDKNFVYDPTCTIEVEFIGEKMGDLEVGYEASFIKSGRT